MYWTDIHIQLEIMAAETLLSKMMLLIAVDMAMVYNFLVQASMDIHIIHLFSQPLHSIDILSNRLVVLLHKE